MAFTVEVVDDGPLAEVVAQRLQNVQLGTPFDRIQLRCRVYEEEVAGDKVVRLSFRLRTSDRDSGRPVDIEFPETLPGHRLAMLRDEPQFMRWVFDVFRKIAFHELSEAFRYKGARVFDPHQGR